MSDKTNCDKSLFSKFECRGNAWCNDHKIATAAIALGIPVIMALAVIFGVSQSRNGIIHFFAKTLPHAMKHSEAVRLSTAAVGGLVLGPLTVMAVKKAAASIQQYRAARKQRANEKKEAEKLRKVQEFCDKLDTMSVGNVIEFLVENQPLSLEKQDTIIERLKKLSFTDEQLDQVPMKVLAAMTNSLWNKLASFENQSGLFHRQMNVLRKCTNEVLAELENEQITRFFASSDTQRAGAILRIKSNAQT